MYTTVTWLSGKGKFVGNYLAIKRQYHSQATSKAFELLKIGFLKLTPPPSHLSALRDVQMPHLIT